MKENETIENRINLYVRTRDYTANITKKRRKNRLFFEKKKAKYAERKTSMDHLLSRTTNTRK
jgi:hypothetical protein